MRGKSKEKACSVCGFEIIDKSEPLIITGACISFGGFVFALVSGPAGLAVVTGVLTVTTLVAEWRVRSLGIAKNLMDSVHDLRDENEVLKNNNEELETKLEKMGEEITKFEEMVGLLGDNVQNIEEAKNELITLYQKYKDENDRQEANNLLTLFGLVDKNEDSRLSQSEIKRMKDYIKIVYKEEFDFDSLDSDDDGFVSLNEFFEKFRKRNIKKIPIKKKLSRRNAESFNSQKNLEHII